MVKDRDEFNNVKEKNTKYYIIKNKLVGDSTDRKSYIEKAPKFILNYESEYLYLFDLIYKKAFRETDDDQERDYILPNAVRKFMEIFLSFRAPGVKSLNRQLKQVIEDTSEYKIDDSVRHRLEKYCHDGSHSMWQKSINDMDEVLLGEIKQVCVDLVNFIEKTDPKHLKLLKKKYEN